VGRPPLGLGTYGAVRTYPTATGRFRARTLYRDYDGQTRAVERSGKSEGAARRALAVALRDRARVDNGMAITPNTKVAVLAEQWFGELTDAGRSPSTLQAYRERLDSQVLPALGEVRIRELTVGVIDRHLSVVKAKNGNAMAKMTKSVLSGMCGLACRHDALESNPCRDVARIATKPKRPPRSLTIEQVKAIRTWLASDQKALDRDLPDLVAFMVATGLRIGEACAVRWGDVDLEVGTVEVLGTVLRVKGKGLVLKPSPKSEAAQRILTLPSWCIGLLQQRAANALQPIDGNAPIFPAPLSGSLRDPSNTRRGLREAFAEMGLPGLTSHAFRKTVATLMDDAGLSARAAADQLGHSKTSMTQDRYMGRKVRATGAAAVLEVLGTV